MGAGFETLVGQAGIVTLDSSVSDLRVCEKIDSRRRASGLRAQNALVFPEAGGPTSEARRKSSQPLRPAVPQMCPLIAHHHEWRRLAPRNRVSRNTQSLQALFDLLPATRMYLFLRLVKTTACRSRTSPFVNPTFPTCKSPFVTVAKLERQASPGKRTIPTVLSVAHLMHRPENALGRRGERGWALATISRA